MISRAQEPALYNHYVAWCLEAGFRPRVDHEVDRTHVAVGLVAGGLAVALVPACASAMPHPGVAYLPLKGARAAAGHGRPVAQRQQLVGGLRVPGDAAVVGREEAIFP